MKKILLLLVQDAPNGIVLMLLRSRPTPQGAGLAIAVIDRLRGQGVVFIEAQTFATLWVRLGLSLPSADHSHCGYGTDHGLLVRRVRSNASRWWHPGSGGGRASPSTIQKNPVLPAPRRGCS